LNFATVVVKNSSEINVDPVYDKNVISNSITNLTGSINIAVPILDVEIYDYCS